MKSLTKVAALTASLIGAGLVASAPANAQVHIGVRVAGPDLHIGVGVGAPAFYYGAGFYPPGPCDAYNTYYAGDCGYAVYDGPIVLEGVRLGGPHYYRWYGGMPYFWYRGGWHVWNGWTRVNFGWDRGEGFGWRDGHWDRAWGDAHPHGRPAGFHDGRGRGREEFRGDRGEHRGGREHGDHHR